MVQYLKEQLKYSLQIVAREAIKSVFQKDIQQDM